MTLTLQTTEAHIRNALGGDSSVEGNGRSIANQAGHYWAAMHDWRCMERFGRLALRAAISIADSAWTESSRTLTLASAFTNYTWLQGDEVEITAGADATTGFYPIQSRSSANAIVLETSIGSSADGDTDIDGTITLDAVALPSDFRQFIQDPIAVSSSRTLSMVSPQEVLEARSGISGFDGCYLGTLLWSTSPAVNGGAPVPRLEIWPSPGSNTSNAFRIHYRAGWVNVSDDSDTIPLPEMMAMELLYLQVVRAVALGYEEFDVASMQARLMEVRTGPEFAAAVRADGSAQSSFGQMRGGAAGRVDTSGSINFTYT